jgi:hypothetical protein
LELHHEIQDAPTVPNGYFTITWNLNLNGGTPLANAHLPPHGR